MKYKLARETAKVWIFLVELGRLTKPKN
jgi:hypothetical protein